MENARQVQGISSHLQPVENLSGTAWKERDNKALSVAALEKWDRRYKDEVDSFSYGPVRRAAEEVFRARFAAYCKKHGQKSEDDEGAMMSMVE